MPTERGGFSADAVGGKIYVIGGTTGLMGESLSTVAEYDPATDTWDTTKADMPTARMFVSSGVVDGKIYVFGGAPIWRQVPSFRPWRCMIR